jgi:hypothetical protein
MFGVPPKCQWPKVQVWRTQKAQNYQRYLFDTSLRFLRRFCAFCVPFIIISPKLYFAEASRNFAWR